MIPKVIHYCWFGKNKIPDQYKTFMKTWEEYCPDYEIVQWNENNFDVSSNPYCMEAYKAGQWAFVSDYARLKIIYEEGGIYLDTDVELVRNIDALLQNKAYIGFQNDYEVNTGLGFGAERHNPAIGTMLAMYGHRHFADNNGGYDRVPCPATNTAALLACGLKNGKTGSRQIQRLDGITIYPEEYFNPMNWNNGKIQLTENTYTIHHYAGSWSSAQTKKMARIKKIMPDWVLRGHDNKVAQKDIEKVMKGLAGRG